MFDWRTTGSTFRRFLGLATVLSLGVEAEAQSVVPPPARETWEVLRLGGQDMGYGHTTWRGVAPSGEELIETESTTHIRVKRFGQTVTQTLRLVSHETPAGRLVDFLSELVSDQSRLVVRGQVADKLLQLTIQSDGHNSAQTSEWHASYGGPFKIEQSLRGSPLKLHETREFPMLLPVYNQVAQVTLEGQGRESVPLLDQERALWKVVCRTQLKSGQALVSHVWVDDGGTIWKTVVQGIGQETYRVDRSRALRAKLGDFDLGEFTVVRLAPVPRDVREAAKVTYKARLQAGEASELFVQDDRQRVKAVSDREVLVTVLRAGQETGPREPPDDAFSPKDLAANPLVQTDDTRVRDMALGVATGERDPNRVVQQLTSFLQRNMKVRDVSRALASAAEVAASMEGDCTEHAVLLVALCRVREIPARAAIGLVYSPHLGGLAYHMWAEAWIDGRWVPFDATRPDGKVGPGHLKMAVSNLHGLSPYEAFWPVMQAMGRLELEVVAIEPGQAKGPLGDD